MAYGKTLYLLLCRCKDFGLIRINEPTQEILKKVSQNRKVLSIQLQYGLLL